MPFESSESATSTNVERQETSPNATVDEIFHGCKFEVVSFEEFMGDFVPGDELPRQASEYYDFGKVPDAVFAEDGPDLCPYIVRPICSPQLFLSLFFISSPV